MSVTAERKAALIKDNAKSKRHRFAGSSSCDPLRSASPT